MTNISHNFVSPLPDGPDPNQVQPSEWNAPHDFTIDHADLTNVTADEHHAQDHVLADASSLGPHHTTSGLTIGHVLRATAAAAAHFMQLLHTDLGGVTADQHHAENHVIADASALGTHHTTSGLTAGHVLRATAATAAHFMQLLHTDLGSVGANDHHNQDHQARHNLAGADELEIDDLATDLTDTTVFYRPDGAGGITASAPPGTGGLVQLAQIVASSSQASFDFTSISSGYSALRIEILGRINDNTNAQESIRVSFNNDTTDANYSRHVLRVDTAATAFQNANDRLVLASWPSAAQPNCFILEIPAYAQTNLNKTLLCRIYTPTVWQWFSGFLWKSTAAINRVTIAPQTHNWLVNSVATLYGLP